MVAISTIVAPIIAGTLAIREYFTAYERVMPPITHAEIVEPRRERPGIVEKPWKNPAISASFGFKFFCVFSPSGSISATTSRIAVRYRPTPGASRFEEVSDKALNHAADYSSRDGGQNQQESKHTVVAAEYLPVLLSLLMLTGKVFL